MLEFAFELAQVHGVLKLTRKVCANVAHTSRNQGCRCPADAAKGLVGMPCACAPTGVMASSNKSPMKEASNVRRGNRNALPTDGFGIKYRRIGESAEGAIRPGALS